MTEPLTFTVKPENWSEYPVKPGDTVLVVDFSHENDSWEPYLERDLVWERTSLADYLAEPGAVELTLIPAEVRALVDYTTHGYHDWPEGDNGFMVVIATSFGIEELSALYDIIPLTSVRAIVQPS